MPHWRLDSADVAHALGCRARPQSTCISCPTLQTWISTTQLTPGSPVTFVLKAVDGQNVTVSVTDPWTVNRSLGLNFS